MVLRQLKAIADLARLDASVFVGLAIFLPVLYKAKEPVFAFKSAVPAVLISMSGYVLNNLHDIERDRENHPKRALPSGLMSASGATILYFSLLAGSLLSLRMFVDLKSALWYIVLLVAITNYNYVVSTFPKLKNIYVALASALPILILSALIPNYIVCAYLPFSVFAYFVGKEMLRDILDMNGDGDTLAKRI